MRDNPRTRVAAHGLCVVDSRVLLVRLAQTEHEPAAWTLPGGGLDWGEAPEQAVVREVREETGLEAKVERIAGTFSHVFARSESRPLDSLHFISVLYWITVSPGELVHELGGSSDLAAWVPLSETRALPRVVGLAQYGLGLILPR